MAAGLTLQEAGMTGKAVWLCVGLALVSGASAFAAPSFLSGAARLSRFAQPGTLAEEARLRDAEERALSIADAAVADMRRLAKSKAESALADRDASIVQTIGGLVHKRRQIREREEMLTGPNAGARTGMRASAFGGASAIGGAPTGAGSSPISAAAGGDSQSQLLAATKQMQETQMSFNLQYLQLQSAMQAENRSYTAISNILRTKHDTVKNSINNIR